MRSKFLVLLAAVAMLAACESTPEDSGAATGTGTGSTVVDGSRIEPGSIRDFVERVGDRVFFDFDRSDLKPEGRALVERWAVWLKQYPQYKVTIQGHADERGTREYNLALGERRAAATRSYLVAQGIPAARVTTISYGKEQPQAVGSNETAWAQNRRAVAVLQ